MLVTLSLLLAGVPLFSADTETFYAREQPRVLLLHSYYPDYRWTANITTGIQKVLEESGLGVHLEIEYLDTRRFAFDDLRPLLLETLRIKYGGEDFSAILCADDNALRLLMELDEKPFNSVPVVVCGINSNWDLVQADPDRITGVFEQGESLRVLNLVQKMHPDSSHFVGIFDASDEGLLFRESAREQVEKKLHSRELIELYNLTVEELANLPDDSVILSDRTPSAGF